MGRFEYGADLLQALEEMVEKEGIKVGTILSSVPCRKQV